jgi:hypothetical protein
MRLFRRKITEAPQAKLLSNLEKIAKIGALRITKDYTDSAVGDINWIGENFINLLKLRETDEQRFLSLIDPNGRYKIIKAASADFGDIDLSNFSMSFIDQLPQEQEIDPLAKKYETVYAKFEPEKINELVPRYIQSIFTIWNAALAKENRLIQKYCAYAFVNWISIIDKIIDEKVNYQAILRTFLDNLEARNFNILFGDSETLPDPVSYFSYNHYLNRIFTDNLPAENIEIYFDYLFRFLYQVVESKKYIIAEQFISRCIDSSYYPSFRNNYSELYSLVSRKMEDNGTEDVLDRLKPIPDLGFYKLNYIETQQEYKDWERELDEYIEGEITPHIQLNEEIEKQIRILKEHAFKIYKFNRLQVTTLKLLGLCLFKGNYSILKHALHYNQPPDSNAIQGNKDILPVSLNEIMNAVSVKYQMEHELLGFWGGHHGVEPYLDRLLVILFYHYKRRRNYGDENITQAATYYCEGKLRNDSGRIEGFKSHIERLKKTFEFLLRGSEIKREFFKDQEKIEETDRVFDEIIEACNQALQKIEKTSPISEATKTRFLEAIIDNYRKYNYLNRFFKKYGMETEHPIHDKNSFGFNEMMDRTAFIEQWYIPYFGFSEGQGRNLAEQENRNAQFVLSRGLIPIKIKQLDIAATLAKYPGEQYVAICRNVHLDMLLYRDENYKPTYRDKNADEIIEGFYQGTYKNLPIFGLYDELFGESIVIIKTTGLLYNENTGEVKEPFTVLADFKVSFIDFGTDKGKLEAMIKKAPIWLQEQFKENTQGLRDYLEKKVWVRMFKRTLFEKGEGSEAILFDIEN